MATIQEYSRWTELCILYNIGIYRFYLIWELLHSSASPASVSRDFICRQATRIPNCSPLKAVSTKIVKMKRVCRKSTPNGSVTQYKNSSCLVRLVLDISLSGIACGCITTWDQYPHLFTMPTSKQAWDVINSLTVKTQVCYLAQK